MERFLLQPKPFEYEHSEMVMYQNMLYSEAGKEKDALKHLQENDKAIVDRLSFTETKGERTKLVDVTILLS